MVRRLKSQQQKNKLIKKILNFYEEVFSTRAYFVHMTLFCYCCAPLLLDITSMFYLAFKFIIS